MLRKNFQYKYSKLQAFFYSVLARTRVLIVPAMDNIFDSL